MNVRICMVCIKLYFLSFIFQSMPCFLFKCALEHICTTVGFWTHCAHSCTIFNMVCMCEMARFECQPPWLFLIAFPHFLVACTSECTKNTGRWFTIYSCLGIIYLINKQVKLGFYALSQTHGGLMAFLPWTVMWLNYSFWSQYAYCVSAVLWWQLWNSMFFFVILLQVTILGGSSGFDSADFTPTWWLW